MTPFRPVLDVVWSFLTFAVGAVLQLFVWTLSHAHVSNKTSLRRLYTSFKNDFFVVNKLLLKHLTYEEEISSVLFGSQLIKHKFSPYMRIVILLPCWQSSPFFDILNEIISASPLTSLTFYDKLTFKLKACQLPTHLPTWRTNVWLLQRLSCALYYYQQLRHPLFASIPGTRTSEIWNYLEDWHVRLVVETSDVTGIGDQPLFHYSD